MDSNDSDDCESRSFSHLGKTTGVDHTDILADSNYEFYFRATELNCYVQHQLHPRFLKRVCCDGYKFDSTTLECTRESPQWRFFPFDC